MVRQRVTARKGAQMAIELWEKQGGKAHPEKVSLLETS